MVDEVQLGHFLFIIPVFPLHYNSANDPSPSSEYYLSGQAGEAWEPSYTHRHVGHSGTAHFSL